MCIMYRIQQEYMCMSIYGMRYDLLATICIYKHMEYDYIYINMCVLYIYTHVGKKQMHFEKLHVHL